MNRVRAALAPRAPGLLLTAAVLLCSGCEDRVRNADDTAAAGGGSGSPASARPTPQMPDSIGAISLPSFTAHVASLSFDTTAGKKDANRKCRPASDAACSGANGVLVDIFPEIGAEFLHPDSLGGMGHVVARLINKGRLTEAKYNLPPDTIAYMVVTRGRARFVYAGRDSVRIASAFTFRGCDDKHLPHLTPARKADFAPCRNAPGTVLFDRDEPAWVSCVVGCCVAETEMLSGSSSGKR